MTRPKHLPVMVLPRFVGHPSGEQDIAVGTFAEYGNSDPARERTISDATKSANARTRGQQPCNIAG
jgi:hypothetical protein